MDLQPHQGLGNMDNYWNDDQNDMFEDNFTEPTPPPPPKPVPLYPLSLAGAPVPQPNGVAPNGAPQGGLIGLATKQMGPLPLWAWALIAGGVGGTGYYFFKSKDGSDDSDSSSPGPSMGDVLKNAFTSSDGGSGSGWSPSRSTFADQLQRYFAKKGHGEHVTVWHDAEDAKKHGGLAHVSPLVNVQVKGGAVKVDTALTRFARREGLNPVQHEDGSIGLYPHTTKRGKEWEQYIDALRDEGQSI